MLTLAGGDVAIQVDPGCGGRLVSWRIGDLEVMGGRSQTPEEYGCYPMAPWAGRLCGNRVEHLGVGHDLPITYAGWAMHGTVLGRAWQVIEATSQSVVLTIDLGASWPWPGTATLSWQLDDAGLSSTLAVECGDAAFPAELGWHPWFARRLERGGDLVWSAAAVALLERGADHLPTGRRLDPAKTLGPYDDAFEVPDGRVEITWPGALRLTCNSDTRWFTVFDELPDLVCIEPHTGPPGALAATAVVTPGAPRRASVRWSWTALR